MVGHDWPEEPPSGQREFPRCPGLTLVRARRARGTEALRQAAAPADRESGSDTAV